MKKKKEKSLGALKKEAWKLLSLVIRHGAADHRGWANCFTCGKASPVVELQAGHAIGGRTGAVLFDEDLLRPQCVACNIYKRGNYPIYVAKLIREHSLEWWEEKLEESRKIRKYTRSELLEMIESYKSRLSVIERAQKWSKAS